VIRITSIRISGVLLYLYVQNRVLDEGNMDVRLNEEYGDNERHTLLAVSEEFLEAPSSIQTDHTAVCLNPFVSALFA